jgi:hypothetical protein
MTASLGLRFGERRLDEIGSGLRGLDVVARRASVDEFADTELRDGRRSGGRSSRCSLR